MVIKSYEVSEKLRREVEETLKEGVTKYECISHIVLESTFDAGAFFEHELEDE